MIDPFADVRPARVGIVGCGDVTRLYLPNILRLRSIELVACADIDESRARDLAVTAGIRAMAVEALLADDTIEIVLNLTPPVVHAAVSRAAIAAGKHVYSEKPLATSLADGRSILAEAATRGVQVGGAPDTFLGGGLQTARHAIDQGMIGEPRLAAAAFLSLGPERWHHRPAAFYRPGAGPILDVAPYYVAALVHLLGPIRSVTAAGTGVGDVRTIGAGPLAGGQITAEIPTSAVATLTFASGAVGVLQASFDVVATRTPFIEVHGAEGSLSLGDPNWFDGSVALRRREDEDWHDLPVVTDATIGRGIGLADLVEAIRLDRPPRASGAFALHVLEILLAIERAASTYETVPIESTCERPAPLPTDVRGSRAFS